MAARLILASWLLATSAAACDLRSRVGPLDLQTASMGEVAAALEKRTVTSAELVKAYLRRIEKCDQHTGAVLSLNPRALEEALRSDMERREGRSRGPLHGVPLIVKDNIDVAGTVTTAGSLALADNLRTEDAPVIARLRSAGAIVIAKANLSEWANFRSRTSSSGWSAFRLTRNARDPTRSACGSSSGSAVAMTLRLAAAAIGTETNGSIVCPSSVTGIVGLKPTVGRVPAAGIVPISASQDTAGPMTATVADAGLLFAAMAGIPASELAETAGTNSLRGVRLGVARFIKGYSPATEQSFQSALDRLKAQGAVLVDIDEFETAELRELQLPILLTEFKAGLNDYLATTPPAVRSRTLADLIEFNRREPRELAHFGQELFEQAQTTRGIEDADFRQKLARARTLAGEQGIDRLLREHQVIALLAPTTGPAWSIDLVHGDRSVGSASLLAAMAGYPHLTVPMDPVAGLPVGLSFFGAAGTERELLRLGAAFERLR